MIDLQKILDEALTIPADKAGPIELKLRDALEKKYKDFTYQDTIVKCCRNDEKSGKIPSKELVQTYVLGLGNIIDLLRSYDKCKTQYIQQKIDKKVKIERADGKTVELDPVKDLNKIGRLAVLKQFIDKFENLVSGDSSIPTTFQKYAILDEDRPCIRLMCWNKNVMVWGTREFVPSQKFAVHLWQNIETIDSGSAYGEPDVQCPYCTHSKNHWDNHAGDDPDYEQYWYLKIPNGVSCTKRGNLNDPEVVKVYNAMKGLGPSILVCQHDSDDDWCDREDNPISEYEIDIHDADETIYTNDDGEIVDPDDYDDDEESQPEEIEFSFGPDDENYFKDVIEIYDSWFTEIDITKGGRKQEWESQREYELRTKTRDIFVSFKGDEDDDLARKKSENEFDFETDIWVHPICLNKEHFQNGILKIQLPKNTNDKVVVDDAEIVSLAGFPTEMIGPNKIIRFRNCILKSAEGWNPSEETKKGLSLSFNGCKIEDSFQLGDAVGGAELNYLEIENGTDGANNLQDLKFLQGSSKLKKIQKLCLYSSLDCISSFDGLADALEYDSVDVVRIINQHTKTRIQSFRGLPKKTEMLEICNCYVDLEAIKSLECIPEIGADLIIKVKNTEQEVLRPLFQAFWKKAGNDCKINYDECGTHSFDPYKLKSIFECAKDNVPSRFNGLKRRETNQLKLNLDLSPKNMWEQLMFLSGKIGFTSSGEFSEDQVPIFKNIDRAFELYHVSYEGYYRGDPITAVLENGQIKWFDKYSFDLSEKPFTRKDACNNNGHGFEQVCFDSGYHGKDFNLDEVLKTFLETRKRDFPETKSLLLGSNYTGTAIKGLDTPDLNISISVKGAPNLAEVSNCRLASFHDHRGKTSWDDNPNKRFESPTVFKDCIFTGYGESSYNQIFEAKAIHECLIIGNEHESEKQVAAKIEINAIDGVFNTKVTSKKSIFMRSPLITGCQLHTDRSLAFYKTAVIENTSLKAGQKADIGFWLSEEAKPFKNITIETSGDKLDTVGLYSYQSKEENASNETLENIGIFLAKSIKCKVQKLDLDQIPLKSLKFLEELDSQASFEIIELNSPRVEDFRFKLKKSGQVEIVGSFNGANHLLDLKKDVTLDGFDASVALSLGYVWPRAAEQAPSKALEEFMKYFTVKPDRIISYAMIADPNYVDKHGQFAAPKTLDERLFGKPTTVDENEWLRVMELFS